MGWHEFRFEITGAGATAFIDGVPVGSDSEITSADTFYIESSGGTEAYWDDVGIAPILPAMLTVNTNDDFDDGNCDDLHCSLREAINAANSNGTTNDNISFDISGSGPHTIQPTSQLPVISEPVIIDGYTQPEAVPATGSAPATLKIELDGSLLVAGGNGLTINTGNSTVRGLVINRFSSSGIFVSGGRCNR